MQRITTLLSILFLLVTGMANILYAAVDIGVKIDQDGIKEFHLAIGEHYNVPEKEIVVIKRKNVPDEELPVIYFLARNSGVDVSAIIKLRLGGKSWMDITTHLGLSAGIYYVQLSKPAGPPYGKAYGHYKKRHRNDWSKIRLTDIEIVDFVNLKFLSKHYGYSPDQIVEMRGKGKNFMEINSDIKKNKKAGQKSEAIKVSEKSSKKKGQGKNPK